MNDNYSKDGHVTYRSSDPSFPELSIPPGFMFTADELKTLEPMLKKHGIKVEKVGPIRLPLHLEGHQKIHFVVKGKDGRSVPVLFHQSHENDPIKLELYLGQLAIWDKFGLAPIVVYSIAPLPKHFDFYLSASPLAKVELGLRSIYIHDLMPYMMKDICLKKAEFITESVQSLLKRNMRVTFKMTDYVHNMASLNVVIQALYNQVPERNERMRNNLNVATSMIAFFFGKCLRFETGMEWTSRANFEAQDQMHIVLKNGWLLSPKDAVEHAVRNNIPLQNMYTDLRASLQTNMTPPLARRPAPKKKDYVSRYFPAGSPEAIQNSIRTLIAEYAPLGLFKGPEWAGQEMVRDFAKKMHEDWPGEVDAELPEYIFLNHLGQILNFDTEDSEEPDNMANLARDIFMLSKGDLIPNYFEPDYEDEQGQYEIIRLGLMGSPITVVADKAEGEFMVMQFVECLNAYLASRNAPTRFYWAGFTDDQTACLAYLERATAEKLLWAKGWPIRLNPHRMNPFNYWVKYAQVLQFLPQVSYSNFRRALKVELGMDEETFLNDPAKALAELIVKLDGFTVAAGATPQESLSAVSEKLAQMGMVVRPGGDSMPGLPSNAAGKRQVPVPVDLPTGVPGDKGPGRVMAEVNRSLAAWGIEIIEKQMGLDILGYAITATKRAEWAIADGILRFRKPGQQPVEKPKPVPEDTWSDYIR